MILDFDYVYEKYNLNVSGLLHIGGHYGGELQKYKSHNIDNIVLFEPLSSNFSVLSEAVKNIGGNVVAHQVALGNGNRKVTMNISSNEAQSSSILTPKVHLTAHPEVSFNGTEEVEMKKLDDYDYKDYNMIVVDVQGYELEVLKGASKTLHNIDYIYCEVNRDEVYEDNARVEEIDDFLSTYGFKRVETQWYYTEVWGDALYMKEKKSSPNVSLICVCKNRLEPLKVSLSSWLLFDQIVEIIIVDWDSEEPIHNLTQLDPRIKVIRVNNKKYFNLAQPLNLAASQATGDYILKVDTDYIINPYYNFFESYSVDENCFISGAHDSPDLVYGPDQNGEYTIDMAKNEFMNVVDYVNCFSQYFRYLRGMLYVSRENFLKVNGYNESIDTYGFEDGDIETKLKSLGLTHKKISYDHSLIHIPHSDKKRIENCKYDLYDEREIRSNLSNFYSGDILDAQTYYGVVSRLVQKNGDASRRKGCKITWKIDQIDDQNYIAEDTIMLKLKEFPSVNYVSLEESTDRQITLVNQFYEYGITNINSVISKRFAESNDVVTGRSVHTLNDGTKGCVVSHLKAIQNWYENTDEDYGFFCEDDLSLETIQYWNFTWEEFIKKIPEDAECVQLLTIRGDFETFELRERQWNDWAATAYIITRDYAKTLIDTYIRNDTYHLDVPNSEVMPLIENLLFVGKTYTAPLFIENIEFNSTFVGSDDDVNAGQKRDHYYAHETVLNYWKFLEKSKSKSFKLKVKEVKKIEKTIEEKLLHDYALDPENPEHNFQLGLWYEKDNHNSAALSYFLRCAERSEDDILTYEALIHGSNCYDRIGTRDLTAKAILQQALMVLPNRPEAYFLLSRFSERHQWWQDCYIYANNGLNNADFNLEFLKTDVEYPGKYGLLYEKSVAAWWWGKSEECKNILLDLKNNYELSLEYSANVHSSMIRSNLIQT
jgi:FkbM family methyltransferase